MPPQNMQILEKRKDGKLGGPGGNGTKKMGPDQEPIRGPQAGRYDPQTDGQTKKFKGGV